MLINASSYGMSVNEIIIGNCVKSTVNCKIIIKSKLQATFNYWFKHQLEVFHSRGGNMKCDCYKNRWTKEEISDQPLLVIAVLHI